MRYRLIIDGNAVYEIDEECMKQKQGGGPSHTGGGNTASCSDRTGGCGTSGRQR